MKEQVNENKLPSEKPASKGEWGQTPEDHFGYKSDEERKSKRGLEDWEMVDSAPSDQRGVPKWFLAVIGFVLLIAIGLSFPFWGDRPGFERAWFDWGFVLALVYLAVAGSFVYAMVRLYGPSRDDNNDKKQQTDITSNVQPENPGNSEKTNVQE